MKKQKNCELGIQIGLVGNPNSGKTTLFNVLTGSTAQVGNWPGVTVDKKTGAYKRLPERMDIVDLPGIYSLSPYTPEEVISRKFVLESKPDCIINIVDATNLERNLYLTTQLLELDIPVVIALNFMDIVEKSGDKLDRERLQTAIGVPVIEISALRGKGIHALAEAAYRASKEPRSGFSVIEGSSVSSLYGKIFSLLQDEKADNSAFRAVKIIENDELETKTFPTIATKCTELKAYIDTGIFEGDYEGIVADARYKYIEREYSPALTKKGEAHAVTQSDKIDRVMTHKAWGIPLFLLIMLAVFHMTFSENFLMLGLFIPEGSFDIPVIGVDAINSPGVMLAEAINLLTGSIGGAVANAMPAGTWYTSLVSDGLLEGLFAILSFLPQILLMFFFLAILEDSGYMARVAFIMDRAFRRLGLSGRAFMPLATCFGCAVPGIMATRTLGNEQERRRTIMLAPFFSCGAKLPIWAAFGGVFASAYTGLSAELVVYSMYILGIAIAVIAAFILKKTIVKGDSPPFVMELPAYHMPRLKNIGVRLWEKMKDFLYRAATVIAGAIVVIWFLSSFGFKGFTTDSEESFLGIVAKAISWLFVPLGFGMGEDGWKFVVAALSGLIAKEMVVGTMGTFAGLERSEAIGADGGSLADSAMGAMMLGIGGTLGGISIAIPAMFAFMAFNLLSVPCMAAVAAARGEFMDKKKLWTAIIFWIATAYTVSLAVFWLGVLFTIMEPVEIVVLFCAIALVLFTVIYNAKRKKRKICSCGYQKGGCAGCAGCEHVVADGRQSVAPAVDKNGAEGKGDGTNK